MQVLPTTFASKDERPFLPKMAYLNPLPFPERRESLLGQSRLFISSPKPIPDQKGREEVRKREGRVEEKKAKRKRLGK